ncbi:hypothetical protein [Novosphingobium mangrovi (ex Huang et al. 2023)]|uniref:Phage DNA packaging protein Nu1 n=1 Tax=Novosphingobium mangrovi (ex Huang et al. 2023) TaxID=2976432 RepID=A0ABT2I138_9SPHN|nr:hypothetical protein [Novosphingobium mangrovi (ex Huang et al. 2023)]MCT2398516.1 hypothetical protein [Novosphingobium mangrovi (ex Huang et al. 2023)]
MSLIVNMDEFSELCGVTPETMRGYVRAVEGNPSWLVERGSRGRDYKIDAEGGLDWWRKRRAEESAAEDARQEQLQLLRADLLGDVAEGSDGLSLSGKQRREEYAAVLERIKLRRLMGELVERVDIEERLSHASVECRRRLMQVPAEFAVMAGLSLEEVKPLTDLLERTVDQFVTAITLPPARETDDA